MENLSDLMQKQLELMQQTGRLFRSNVSGDIIFLVYYKWIFLIIYPIQRRFCDEQSSIFNNLWKYLYKEAT
jgi:hypothetical protein